MDWEVLDSLLEQVKSDPVTLLYASRNEGENNAQVLKELLQERIESIRRRDRSCHKWK